MKETNVIYRHISIPLTNGEIVGFSLWYQSKNEAKNSILRFHKYLESLGTTPKYLKVSFNKDSALTHQLKILIVIKDTTYSTIIDRVDSIYVERIIKSLGEYPYFFITAGFTKNGEETLLPINPYNFISSEIEIDGKLVRGNNKKKWPVHVFDHNWQIKLKRE